MTALTALAQARLGTASPGANVAATDTIAAALLGAKGVLLEILNGNAATDNMTISDAGASPAGTPAVSYPIALLTATNRVFKIHPSQADPVTGLVTITHSVQTTVTYKLYQLG